MTKKIRKPKKTTALSIDVSIPAPRAAPAPAKLGRKTKLDSELVEQVCSAIRAGNYAKVAAQMSGISEATFYRWIQQGAEDERLEVESDFREFRESIKRAEALCEGRTVANVQNAAPTHWQAAMTWLERRHPERWGRRDKIEQTTRDLTEELKTLTRAGLDEFERLLLAGIAPDRALARARKFE